MTIQMPFGRKYICKDTKISHNLPNFQYYYWFYALSGNDFCSSLLDQK